MINKVFWKGKKVFLTGHTGFKGSWLSIWLNELGAEVCGYALEPNTTPSLFKLSNVEKYITSVIGDIRDLLLLKESMMNFAPDIVIHMAAQPLVKESYENPVDTYAINVMGTVNLLESVRHCSTVKAVINITTDKVYENKEWVWGYRETDRLGGYDPYSNSKACSEFVTSSYINSFFNPKNYAEHGVAIATVRAGNVIGGGDWAKDRLIPDILHAINSEKVVSIRSPHAIRPWQHVLEPLSGYMMLCEKLFSEGIKWNGPWNFGPSMSDTKSVLDIVKYMEKIHPKHFIYNTENMNQLHETNILSLDSTKANIILNWIPRWSIETALNKIVEWDIDSATNNIYDLCVKQLNDYSKVN